jgi:hypothetical protein
LVAYRESIHLAVSKDARLTPCPHAFCFEADRRESNPKATKAACRVFAESALSAMKVKSTGLTQNSQVDPAVLLKVNISALGLTQILGQPCGFQVIARDDPLGERVNAMSMKGL